MGIRGGVVGAGLWETADRSALSMADLGGYLLPQGASATTVDDAAFLTGISRLIGAATSPGRPRSSVKFRVTDREMEKIVGRVADGMEGKTDQQQVPGGEWVPDTGSGAPATETEACNETPSFERDDPRTSEWS